jgi:hypothetical protein
MPQRRLDRRRVSPDTAALLVRPSGAKGGGPLPQEGRPPPSAALMEWSLAILTIVITFTLIGCVWSFSYGGSSGDSHQLVRVMSPRYSAMGGPATRDWISPSNGEVH